jgi:hypothetical protein
MSSGNPCHLLPGVEQPSIPEKRRGGSRTAEFMPETVIKHVYELLPPSITGAADMLIGILQGTVVCRVAAHWKPSDLWSRIHIKK